MVRRRSEGHAFFFSLASVGAVAAGWLALAATGAMALPLGLRPALFLSELALVTPALAVAALFGALPELLGARAASVALRAVGAGAALWLLSLGLMDVQARLWPPPPGYLEAFRGLHALLRPAGPADALVSLAVIALMPALCEELVFRGLVLPAFTAWRGLGVGLAASSLLFGAIHLDQAGGGLTAYRVPFAIVVGLGFGLLRLRTRTLLAPVLAHATLNALTFAAVPLFDEPVQETAFPHPAIGLALAAAGALAVAWLTRKTP
jgi:membrane protease YdiL (CAAX protease family)